MAPCLVTSSTPDVPTAKVGGQTAVVTSAGWVADSIAGLYQVNITLPPNNSATSFSLPPGVIINGNSTITGITVPVRLPIVVKANNVTQSGPGVAIWVAPRLTVQDPDGNVTGVNILSEHEPHVQPGAPCGCSLFTSNLVTATGGQGPYTYAVTSGLLPNGVSFIGGVISGTPGANTAGLYTLTITATDSSTPPITGTVTFQLQINGGLLVTATPSTLSATFASPVTASFVATGGDSSYSYVLTGAQSLPASITVSPSGAFASTALTPAGTYNDSVTATDTSSPPLTGIGILPVTINLGLGLTVAGINSSASISSVGGAANGILCQMVTHGATGAVTYALDSVSQALGFSIDNTVSGY